MRAGCRLKQLYLAYFSKPKSDRQIYRTIRRQQVRSILELGIGNGRRALRMIATIKAWQPDVRPQYTGVDLFEARQLVQSGDDGGQLKIKPTVGLSLKQAFRLLKGTGARIQLAPGDPCEALTRLSNMLHSVDLVIISHDQDADALDRAWFYLPRMLHDRSLILQESVDGERVVLSAVERSRIDALARRGIRRAA